MAAPMINFFHRISRFSSPISRLSVYPSSGKYFCSSARRLSDEQDVEKLFMKNEVQSILKNITGFDLNKINAPQLMELQESKVQLMSDDELNIVQERALEEAKIKLQMPPVLKPRQEYEETLSNNPEISEAIDHRMIFTDITFGIPNRKRHIVVRECDGLLREAKWSERERMLQTYFPESGKKLRIPKMFEDENLMSILDEERYKYLLERACLQFEPDDPEYIRVVETTYNHIQGRHLYSSLHSTRHFGPMAFHYAKHKAIDNLLIYFLKDNDLMNAANLVRLFHIIHPGSKSACKVERLSSDDYVGLVQTYCDLDAEDKGELSLLLQSQKEQGDAV